MKKKYIRVLVFSIGLLTFLPQGQATHNRAGEITWQYVNGNTIRVKVTTYTKSIPNGIDRPFLSINWGDGSGADSILRTNGTDVDLNGIPTGEFIGPDLKLNEYVFEYTYPGTGHYRITVQDPNREGGICNVNPPFSVNVPFFLQTTVTIRNPQFGEQNAPLLFQLPIDDACVGQPFKHNPGAYDPDNDSLAFRLAIPLEGEGTPVNDFIDPQDIEPGANNLLTINEVTGDIVWNSPQKACTYNIAILIIDYRNGIALDTVLRDMQIIVKECNNRPPLVKAPDEFCVIAGEVIEFEVRATDPDIPLQLVELTADGAPFELDVSPATFTAPDGYVPHPAVGIFRWQTSCEHISDQVYFLIFKAKDDYAQGNDDQQLADLKTVRIKVVGPPPEDVQAESSGLPIRITWQLPYACENADNQYFRGFSVWRRLGSNAFSVDSCTPGLKGKGYTQVARFERQNDGSVYFYEDSDVDRGITYCYRILGEFAQVTPGPNPLNFNNVESLASDEICTQLPQDVPLLINVDVTETNADQGEIFVRWIKPNAEDLDTLKNPGPYRFELFRSDGFGSNFMNLPAATATSATFGGLNDTTFIDQSLNTVSQPYTYRIDFYVQGNTLIENNTTASSIFLTIASTDNTNTLTWQSQTPWTDTAYVIYRQLPGNTTFDSLTTLKDNIFVDSQLKNGAEYCYYVLGIGDYGIASLPFELLNKSQRACGVPIDTMPSCPPQLTVSNQCQETNDDLPEEQFFNSLEWTNPNESCEDTDDVISYRVYYAEREGQDLRVIGETSSPEATEFEHKPEVGITGCYYVTAIDSFDNESALSNRVCAENCPYYELPNAFTPNGDGQNDVFKPYPYRFVASIDMKIFDRWGTQVFATEDPDINWTGRDMSGNEVSEGTYFYVCKWYERLSDGTIVQSRDLLQGYIELVRGAGR